MVNFTRPGSAATAGSRGTSGAGDGNWPRRQRPGRYPRLKRPPTSRKGSLRRRPILMGVPPPHEGPFFKSGLFHRSGVILTVFVSAIFHENREIDLFTRIARHKLPETLIFASDFVLFTSAGLNRANRALTDRESRLRSGYGAYVPTAGSMDRGVGGLFTPPL